MDDHNHDHRSSAGAPPAAQLRLLATLEQLLAIRASGLKGALDEAAQLIAEALAADKVDAFLYDPDSASLVAVGTSDTPLGRRQHQLGLDRLPLANGGRIVAVYQSGAPFHTGHTEEDPDELLGIKRGLGVRSTLAAAIEVGTERNGVLGIVSTQPERFSEEDARFCTAAAGWVGLVAQRAELAEQLAREAATQARRVAADELIEILAHDLRTPLTPAAGYLELLRRRALAEGRERDVAYADQIALAHARLRRMIDALLDAGRLEQGLFALELRPVDLAALVRETVATLRTLEADLTVRGPDELVAEAVDPERLRQALENLVSNALAHAPAGTPVVVEVVEEARAEGSWAVLAVRDAGPGIAPELVPTLFERFARGRGSQGLGLGLYLARGIAEAHKGSLTVESKVGRGTTFQLSLPLGDR